MAGVLGIATCYHFSMGWLRAFLVFAAIATTLPVLPVWAQAPASLCHDPLKPMLRVELYFGRDMRGHHIVSDRQWAHFLAHDLSPAFPEGLTVFDGRGQWRDPGRATITREQTKIVVIVTPDSGGVRARVTTVVSVYKDRFQQHSVGVVMQQVYAAF
jgi:hypothetical protein